MAGASGTEANGADSPETIAAEARLAKRAAEGDGAAFATLYDRYEQRIFTFCQRLTGSADDAADATQEAFVAVLERLPKLAERDLNFGAYLFTTARHAAYRAMEKRRRAEPTDVLPDRGASGGGFGAGWDPDGDPEEDPERKALVEGQQEQIRAAQARLPDRQREVLVLRELEELSYDEIAEIMDMNRNSVAQLISRARIKLRDELRGEALASIAVSSPDCEKALPLIAMRDDGQLEDPLELAWLEQHLAECDTCRASVEAMHEAGMSYRALAPVVVFEWLRRDTIARAAENMGFDWSDVPPRSRDSSSHGSGGAGSGGAGAGAGGGEALAAAGAESASFFARSRDYAHEHRKRLTAGAVALLLLLLGGVTALAVGGDDTPSAPSTAKQAAGTVPLGTTTEAAGSGQASGDGGGGGNGHGKAAAAVIPGVGTTTTTTKATTTAHGTKTTTVAAVQVAPGHGHKPKRTHTHTPPGHTPKQHRPKPSGGGNTPAPTPAPSPDPTPNQDTPPPVTHEDTPAPAPTPDPTPPTTTTTAIAGPPPSSTPTTTPTTTPTRPCRPTPNKPCP